MDISVFDGIGVIKTKEEFIVVIHERLHGPYPTTKDAYNRILAILEDGGNV
ncbi:hypothetical protein [Paenibacillus oleatilyticus]|uniref:Uncharacterized protein n=1 Tax=Paenibacillus oleatilyticus TaxID=2594886 RepID=A0ABV4UXG8_9BACL